MNPSFWLERVPLWGVFCISLAIFLASIWIGNLLGHRRRRQPDHEAEASLGTIIAAMLGLLAFLLAFTFNIAAEIFQNRRQLLLNEVNAIGTTYLRAGLLAEPHRSQIRSLLRQYVDARVNLAKQIPEEQIANLKQTIQRTEALQDQIWSHAEAIGSSEHNSVITALFINSLNDMIDLQTSRVTVFNYRIPPVIWNSLYFITILSMLIVGYQMGLSAKSIVKVGIVLALTFSAVIFLIADLDRTHEGYLRVSQQPMLELQHKLQTSPAETNH